MAKTKAAKAAPVFSEEGIRRSIYKALRCLDPGVIRRDKHYPVGFTVLGENVGVEIQEQRTTGSRRWSEHAGTGRWQVTVGGYKNAKRFMAQKNDFDYDTLAKCIFDFSECSIKRREANAIHEDECKAFMATREYAILDRLGVSAGGRTNHYAADILRKLSPAAFDELERACGIERKDGGK